ncbi:LysM peptidoglycan-binding domain-containing protein [Parafrankia sp. FMc2]|uniref:LysM peptidoglycan-binding domain-containing protein n=1 Tax=Parafrankia sp. FMc2 TaxID=3233196 RepID=UPI0034D42494
MSQRTGTRLLTADETATVRALLGLPLPPEVEPEPEPTKPEPAAAAAKVVKAAKDNRHAWKEAHPTQAAREEFAGDLRIALKAAIDAKEASISRKENARVIDLSHLLPAAAAAKEVVDEFFAEWVGNALVPAELAATRRNFTFTVGGDAPTIVSMADTATRRRLGRMTEPVNMVDYLMGTDVVRALAEKHFFHYQNGTPEERDFYQKSVVEPFVADHSAALLRYEASEMSMSDPNTVRIFITPWVLDWAAEEAETESMAVAAKKWDTFVLLIHEYIHVLQHPLLPTATQRSVVVREGFCEYLAVKVTRHVGSFSDERIQDLNRRITGQEHHRPSRAWLPDYSPTADYAPLVKRVTEAMGTVGENAIHAAFFQGHTEFLGTAVSHAGERYPMPPVTMGPDGARRLPFPVTSGRRGHDWISRGTGIPAETFAKLNADVALDEAKSFVPDGMDLQISVPGFRAHRVLGLADGVGETWEQIARQNGTTVDELMRINDLGGNIPAIDDLQLEWVLVQDS